MDNNTKSTDQYDTILRSLEKGVILTINDSSVSSTPTDELKVTSSSNNETDVSLEGMNDTHWSITRNHNGKLVFGENTHDGFDEVDEVITFEIVGINNLST